MTAPLVNGRYELGSSLARGAFAEVYRARDQAQQGAPRALKVCAQGPVGPAGADRRGLLGEFARLSELAHPHLPRVFDLDIVRSGPLPSGATMLVEELIEGQPLDQALAARTPADRALAAARLLAESASALGYLHARGILHRDVSPGNILVEGSGKGWLIDLGLTGEGGAAGTLAYMAPEVLMGEGDARSDLYALGATFYRALSGRPPHPGQGGALVHAILERDLAALEGVPAPLERIVTRLCARDPAARHPSAAVLLEDLKRLGDFDLPSPEPPRGEAASGLLVGRDAELERLVGLLRALAKGEVHPPVVVVAGTPGSGRSRLVAEALRRLRLQAAAGLVPPLALYGQTLPEVARQLGAPLPADDDGARARDARDVGLLAALGKEAPALVHLPSPGESELALATRAARGLTNALVLLELGEETAARPPWAERAEWISLRPLTLAEVERLCEAELGRPVRLAFVQQVAAAAGGTPLGVRELLRAAGPEGDRRDVSTLGGEGLLALVATRLAAQPPGGKALLAALAALGGRASARELIAVAEPGSQPMRRLAQLLEQGLITASGEALGFPSGAHAQAAWPLGEDALWRRALARRDAPALRARLHEALGQPAEAGAAHLAAGQQARLALDLAAAAHHFRSAFAAEVREAQLPLAETLVDRGEYREALVLLSTLPPREARAIRARARALGLSGQTAAAEALLREALGHREDAVLRHQLGRLLLARGALAEARALGAGPEIEGLAALYQGDFAHGESCLSQLAAAATDDVAAARAQLLLGNAAHLQGHFERAERCFAQAHALATRVGDVHTAAPAAGSLGAARKELGDFGGALGPMREALATYERLGQTAWFGGVLNNLGALLLELGDVAAASQLAQKAAAQTDSPLLLAIADLLKASISYRDGHADAAVLACERAERVFSRLAEVPFLAAARRARALALCALGQLDEAEAALGGLSDDADTRLVRARVALARGDAQAAARAAAAAKEGFRAGARRGELWRAELLFALATARGGNLSTAREALERARLLFEEIRMKTPDIYRDGWATDPDVQRLYAPAPSSAQSSPVPSAPDAPAEARLRRLLAVNKRLNSELRLPRLLELIIDQVIELTGGERGFLLLEGKDGKLAIKVARNIAQATLGDGDSSQVPPPAEAAELAVSRSIAERVARDGQPIVTIDAQGDARFLSALSVSDLRLRSVLAVPLRIKGRVVGTLYVDHRLRRGAFGDADVALVLDFADQAAIAIDNARLLTELRRARKRAEELAAELAVKVDAQQAELHEMRVELASSREALAVRYNYDALVGRTPRMLDLFRLLDRVTETELPVVLLGESGTGKELAARAIHHNGRRRERPFVGENCAAIPETLLESTLFGYARGAFTGAERDCRGLFEIASGGTLFLDEVTEMSPAMQTKLLRVLQDGEFRRLGDERSRKADVRLIAASNKDLGRLVEEGKFREDLYYRLHVVGVEIPPLRERSEDIPLLCDHFLRKQAKGGAQKRMTQEAMGRLMGYAWPGNVRELENEILRAAALCEEAIGVGDLSPRIASGEMEATPAAPGDLSLRTRVGRLERSLIREALRQADGNQTRAAQLLGVSRFGLQKKLARYRVGRGRGSQ